MKLRRFSARPKATRIFTDREEPRESFWNTYDYLDGLIKNDPEKCEATVLSYYGIGGVGKTKLLQKLLQEITEKKHKAVYFDFSTEKDHLLVLEAIKNQLHKKYNFSFTLFEIGHYVYANKVGQIREMPRRETFLNRYPTLDAFVEAMGTIPTVNIGSQFIKALDKGVTCLLNSDIDYKRIIRNLENWEPQDLYEYLTELFCEDMVANLEKAKEPLVILLDTYEEFVGEGSSESQSIKNDLWISGPNGLARVIPNVLWVIAGRNKLSWAEEWTKVEDNGRKSLNEHIINGLSEHDATSFLMHTGVSDEGLRHELYGLTEGLPVYLDLCVDRYFEILDEGKKPEISQFGKNIETLVARFAKNLDHNTKELVNILSCLRIWNDEMVHEIVPQVFKGFTLSLYEKIKDYSFIVLSDETTFNMHQTVGDILFKKCPDSIKKATETSVVEFMDKKFKTINAFSGEYVFYTRWLMQYALRSFQDDEKLSEFFDLEIEDRLEELSRYGQFKAAYDILGPLIKWAEKSEDKKFCVYVLNALSNFYSNAGEYQDAFETCLDAVDLAEEIVFDDGDNFFRYDMMLTRRNLGNCLNDIGRYDDALEVFNDLLADWKNILGEDHEETLEEMNHVANTLMHCGKYQEALDLQEKLLEKSKRISGEDDHGTLVVMGNLANTLSKLGKHTEALELEEKVLAKYTEKYGEDDLCTLSVMGNLASSLSKLGKHTEALELEEKVLAKYTEIFGEEHPDTLNIMQNLATTLSSSGKINESLSLEKEILSLKAEILGENHPLSLSIRRNITISLDELNRHEEALAEKEKLLSTYKEVYGEDHPETIDLMLGICYSLVELGQYQEHLKLSRQVLDLCREKLGNNHPQTIEALNNVAYSYFLKREYKTGIPYAEEAVKLQEHDINISEDSKINTLDTLSLLYAETGNIDSALDIASSNLRIRQTDYASEKEKLASGCYTMAYCLNKAQRYQEALPYAKQAHTNFKEQFGEDRIDTVKARELLEDIKDNLN